MQSLQSIAIRGAGLGLKRELIAPLQAAFGQPLIAAVDFALLRLLASRVELDDTKRVLNITGLSQFVLLPIVGWFAGPFIAGE